MRAVVLLLAGAVLAMGQDSPPSDRCSLCVGVVDQVYKVIDHDDSGQLDAVLESVCSGFDNTTLSQLCVTVLDDENMPTLLSSRVPTKSVCVAARMCEQPPLVFPPPSAPVEVEGGDDDNNDDGAFHAAGKDEAVTELVQREREERDQTALQLQGMQSALHGMSPTINVAAPPPVGGGSGLAWDKHDFDVTNNKGGDVDVEVNLAAPMSAAGGDDGDDLAAVVEALAQDQGPDPLDLVKMIMKAQGSDDSSEVARLRQAYQANADARARQMTTWMKGITDALSELGKQQAAPPPPQSGYDIPAIIEALHPPPSPQQPPIDIAALMREMRAAVESGKQAPPCPPGVDPALMDMLKQAMEALRDMHKDLAKALVPTPPPLPSPAPVANPSDSSSSSLSLMPPPLPPPPGVGGSHLTADQLADLLKKFQLAAPLPMPPRDDSSGMDALKDLLAKQALMASKPIILPPPVSALARTSLSPIAPPPPPPPASAGTTRQDLLDLLNQHVPSAQRIPAPPVITHRDAACCSPPPPEDRRPDEARCPKVDGAPLPRCKRTPQNDYIKCKKYPCGKAELSANDDDAAGTPNAMEDGFNPRTLLASLCRGGKCPVAGAVGRRPVVTPSQTGS